jgi:hypothetical protein
VVDQEEALLEREHAVQRVKPPRQRREIIVQRRGEFPAGEGAPVLRREER